MKHKNASPQQAQQRAIAVLRDVLGAERFGEWLLNGFVELGEFILVAPNNRQACQQGYPGGFPPFLYLYGIDKTGMLVLYGFRTVLWLLEDALAQLVLWAESRPEKLRRIACEFPAAASLNRQLRTALARRWLERLKSVKLQRLAPIEELWLWGAKLGLDETGWTLLYQKWLFDYILDKVTSPSANTEEELDNSFLPQEMRCELAARLREQAVTLSPPERARLFGELRALVQDCPDIYNELIVSRIHEAISLDSHEKKELLALTRDCPEMIEIVEDLDLMDVAELVRDF